MGNKEIRWKQRFGNFQKAFLRLKEAMDEIDKFGIYDKSYGLIIDTLRSFPDIEKAFIFGSSAMGNEKKGSDIDPVISGEDLSGHTLNKLRNRLNEESPIPYYFDIVQLDKIGSKELRDQFNTSGILFYEKGKVKSD